MSTHTIDPEQLLAVDLVSNYLRSSLEGWGAPSILEEAPRIVTEEYWDHAGLPTKERPDDRIAIAVLGAGASAVYHGLPCGGEAIEKICRSLGLHADSGGVGSSSTAARAFQHHANRLIDGYRLPAGTFETQLLACSNLLGSKEVTTWLDRLYNVQYVPSLLYEVLAHLLKHRFLDAVINFNFDELFDQALDAEMGPGEYTRVVSDADCPRSPTGGRRYDLPVYVKPHGTIRQHSTLLFTREQYHQIPDLIGALIQDLIGRRPVSLWVIGFAMQSPEFRRTLKAHLAPGSRITYLDRAIPDANLPQVAQHHLPATDKPSFSRRIANVWATAAGYFRDGYKPRSITRHELLATLFEGHLASIGANPQDQAAIGAYIGRRVDVEIAIAIAKAKGFVNVKDLGAGRPHKVAAKTYPQGQSIGLRCKLAGLAPISYSSFAVRIGGPAKDPRHQILPAEDVASHLVQSCLLKDLVHDRAAEIQRALVEIADGTEVEISADLAEGTEAAFLEPPQRLRNRLELAAWTNRLLRDGWDNLLVVAETGDWLRRSPALIEHATSHPKARIALITADSSRIPDLKAALRPGAIVDCNLHWFSHNHHMTIFMRRDGRRAIATAAIFFVRRLRSSRVAPVIVREEAPLLLNTFAAYWYKATNPIREYVKQEQLDLAYADLNKKLGVEIVH